jgi:hypothetical protein
MHIVLVIFDHCLEGISVNLYQLARRSAYDGGGTLATAFRLSKNKPRLPACQIRSHGSDTIGCSASEEAADLG